MKKLFNKLLFLIIASLIFSQLEGQTMKNSSPEQLAINLFEIIKNNRVDQLENFFPSKEEWGEILSVSKYNKKTIESILGSHEKAHKIRLERSTKEFHKIRNLGKKKGDALWAEAWISAIYINVRINNINVPEADVYVYYIYDNSTYTFDIYDCALAKRGWLITKRIENPVIYHPKNDVNIKKRKYVAQSANLGDFGKRIFKLFKNNKISAIASLFPTNKEMVDELKLPAHIVERILKSRHEKLNNNLKDIYKIMAKIDISLNQAVFLNIEYRYGPYHYDWVKRADLKIIFKHSNSKFILRCYNCLKLKRGWLLYHKFELIPLK
jgi:hypothetical protein